MTEIIFFGRYNDRSANNVRHFDEFVGQAKRGTSLVVGNDVAEVSDVASTFAVYRTSVASRSWIVMVANTKINKVLKVKIQFYGAEKSLHVKLNWLITLNILH